MVWIISQGLIRYVNIFILYINYLGLNIKIIVITNWQISSFIISLFPAAKRHAWFKWSNDDKSSFSLACYAHSYRSWFRAPLLFDLWCFFLLFYYYFLHMFSFVLGAFVCNLALLNNQPHINVISWFGQLLVLLSPWN